MEFVTHEEFIKRCTDYYEKVGTELNVTTLLRADEDLQPNGIAYVRRYVTGMVALFAGTPIFGWRNDELLGAA